MGEDLDLSWRSQVAGSRVVVAPDARVRHREAVAGGLAPLAVVDPDEGRHPVTMQMLQRRHELRAVLKCYTRFHRLRVLPQAALLALGELVVAVLARDGERVRAVSGAWRWNIRHRRDVRLLRKELAAHRLFPDAEVRRLQLHGSARLSRYFSRLTHQGLEAANAVAAPRRQEEEHEAGRSEEAVLTGSVGLAFSEDADFDDLDDLGHRAGRDRYGRRVRSSPLVTGRQRMLVVVVALAVVAFGTRGAVLRLVAPGRAAGAAGHVVGELAPPVLRLAVGGCGHHRARLAGLRRHGDRRNAPVRLHGHGAAPPSARVYPARRPRDLAFHAATRVGSGPGGRRGLLPGPSPALRGPRDRALGWTRRVRVVPLHRHAPGPGRRAGAFRCRGGATLAQHPSRPGRRARRAGGRGGRVRAGCVPHGPGRRAVLGRRLGTRRRGQRCRPAGPHRARGARGGPGPHRAVGYRDDRGRPLGGDHLRLAGRTGECPGLGRGHPFRHRARGALAGGVARGRGRRAAAASSDAGRG